MALTRKFLTALGIEDAKVDEIISAHAETVDALKEQRDAYKDDAEKLAAVTKERDSLKKELEAKSSDEDFKEKYNSLKSEFETYKTEQDNKSKAAKREKAYRELLKDAGVSEKRIDAVIKVSDLNNLEFDEEGNLKDSDKLTESIKSEWSDFIVSKGVKGVDTATPPKNIGGKMTKDEIMKIADTTERQKAMAENHELFGI